MEFPYEIGQEVFLIGTDNKVYKKAIRGIEYTLDGGLWLLFNDDRCRCYAALKTFEEAVQVLLDNEENRHKFAMEQIENNYVSGPQLEEIATPF